MKNTAIPINIKNILFAITMVLLALSIQSCSDEGTAEPFVPGSDRDKFVGSWKCKETYAGQAPNTFTINIQKHGSDDTLYVYNFNNLGSSLITIWLVSSNSVVIPNQSITQTVVSGSGFYNNGVINLTYSSDGEQVTAECTPS